MRIDILTLFPGMFEPVLRESMLRIAQEKGLVEFHLHDLRAFGEGSRRNVDDRPYGGGPGMVLMCGPVFDAVESIERESRPARRILTSPQGRLLTQKVAEELAGMDHLLIICGHYEGYDERIPIGLDADEISVGDFVLTGGELAAMCIVDAVTRLISGVLGDDESSRRDCFSSGLLGWPQYTRPPVFRGMEAPELLRSGDHGKVAAWREEQARLRTAQRRPDLLMKKGDVPPRDTP